jgi:hypothetical protein
MNVPIIGGMTLSQSNEENNRRVLKLQTCELALLESIKKVNECKTEFKHLMPKIFSSFRATGALTFVRVKIQLMNLADSVKSYHDCSDSVIHRFKSQISATSSTPLAAEIGGKRALMGYEPSLRKALTALSQEGLRRKYVRNDGSLHTSEPFAAAHSSVNMTLESIACLAACPPTILPPLPSSFRKCVGVETCVWFNAFSGRIYRDAAKSEALHTRLLEKLTKKLNKGPRPGFVDEFTVESIVFGSTPPLLFNVKWCPPAVSVSQRDRKGSDATAAEESKTQNDDKNKIISDVRNDIKGAVFTPHEKDSVNSKHLSPEKPSRSSPFADTIPPSPLLSASNSPNLSRKFAEVQSVGSSGKKSVNYDDGDNVNDKTNGTSNSNNNNSSSSNSNSSSSNSNSSNSSSTNSSGKNSKESNMSGDTSNECTDDDIECTANIAFRSGLKFKISTRYVMQYYLITLDRLIMFHYKSGTVREFPYLIMWYTAYS